MFSSMKIKRMDFKRKEISIDFVQYPLISNHYEHQKLYTVVSCLNRKGLHVNCYNFLLIVLEVFLIVKL